MSTKELTWEWDLTDEQLDFLKLGTKVDIHEKDEKGKLTTRKFYYMPYWFEELSNGYFKAHSLDSIPQELVEAIHRSRELTHG